MKDLVIFDFEGNGVRAGLDKDGEPFWVGRDICDRLGYKNSRKTLGKLDDDERGVTICYSPGGDQEMVTVNESGLYTLILRSNKPEARKFRKWITGDVLPKLRRTGTYAAPALSDSGIFPAKQVLAWRDRCIDQDMRDAVRRTRLSWPQFRRVLCLREAGLTQAEAGKLYDVSRDTVARLEKTRRRLYETTYFLPGHPLPKPDPWEAAHFGLRLPPRNSRPAARQLSLLEGGAR